MPIISIKCNKNHDKKGKIRLCHPLFPQGDARGADGTRVRQCVPNVLEYVKSVSYPNSKADHLVKMARQLVERHGGEVPEDMNLLLDLPGVGRKTANVIQSVAFGKSTMAVDTHVFRVSHRLGLVSKKDDTPYKVEQVLVKNIPMEDIPRAHHWLLLHGRYICTSRRPHCEKCGLVSVCPSATLSSSCDGNGSRH